MAQLTDERRARYRHELESSETPMRGQNKIAYLKLSAGKTKVRVLPGLDPSSPDKDFYCKAGTHYWANPNNPKLPVPCAKTKNPRSTCVICTRVDELKNSSNKADNAEAEKLRVRVRYYMGLILREGEDAGKVMVYAAPKAIYTKILSYMEDPEYGDVTSPTEGYDITLHRSGTGKETKYEAVASRISTPISENAEEIAAVLEAQPELWRFREAPIQEEVKKFMAGELDRFTTGGFAIKTVGIQDINTGETTKMVVPSSVGMGLDPDLAVEPETEEVEEPAPSQKTRKFSNLDKVRAELSK